MGVASKVWAVGSNLADFLGFLTVLEALTISDWRFLASSGSMSPRSISESSSFADANQGIPEEGADLLEKRCPIIASYTAMDISRALPSEVFLR